MEITILERLENLELTLVQILNSEPNTGEITIIECYMNDSQLEDYARLID